ncbi:IclR family transcriptional regulator [Methylocapsa sp. S129]|uniref:IclR family transcriptional regulator n=1 Tax=Methylocapsa sp. S129 TaxID=1641869 RepID=UPI00131B2EB6|nr:IclR family transcriptional regulator [Methylocapsa sp. S129]
MSDLQLGTLEKAVKILNLYDERVDALTFSEIVVKTGLEKGSVQRLLFSLQNLGLLRRHQKTKRYSLSPRIVSFAVSFSQTDPLMLSAPKYLEPLARLTTAAISLAIMDGINVFYMHRVSNLVTFDLALLPVRRLAYTTAAGRAMLSRMSDAEITGILAHSPMTPQTNKTIVDPDQIRRILTRAREDGIAWQDEEVVENEIGIAAPVLGDGGIPVAAVTLSMNKAEYDLETALRRFTIPVQTAARNLSNPALTASRIFAA